MSETGAGPSKKGYWVGGAIIVLAGIGAIVWFAVGLMSFSDKIEDFQRVPVNGEGEVTLDEAGGYVIYYEGPGASDGDTPSGQAELTPASGGESVALDDYDESLTYDIGDHSGVAVLTADIERPGSYVLASESEGSGELAIGRSVAGTLVVTVVGAMALGGLGLVAGVVILIVTAVRRKGGRPRNAPWIPPPPGSTTPPPPPPPSPGYSGSTPPPPWPPPME